MDIIWIATFYIILVAILGVEASDRVIGSWSIVAISTLFTPLIGLIVLLFSRKKVYFHHYVKLQNGNINDKSLKKKVHTNGKDKWVELKSSELKPV